YSSTTLPACRFRIRWSSRGPPRSSWYCSCWPPISSGRVCLHPVRARSRRQESMLGENTADPSVESGRASPTPATDVVIDCHIRELYYGTFKAVRDTTIPIEKHSITAFIGPSGCGKSTVLRCLNRMNDLVRGFRFEGHVRYRGRDIYHSAIDPVAVRRFIGMVFQQPNPFATSIYNN